MMPAEVLKNLWQLGGLPTEALRHALLTGTDPVLPSSFAVGTAAQTPIAAAALAACELGHLRGQTRQDVRVDMTHAALECSAWFSLDGLVPEVWDKFSGLYACADGWVRVHANFAHHREGALRLMGLNPATATRADAEKFMLTQNALAFEQAAADAHLVVAAFRSFDEWDALPQARAIRHLPLLTMERLGDAPPLNLPPITADERPLAGVRVLDLTRILAGPVCGRALAAYGADVMLINAQHLPNIESIADTSRGKLSAHVDLRTPDGQQALQNLLHGSHVFVQGYRPGALEALHLSPQLVAQQKPGIVCVSLSAYGDVGPWRTRRGFDSLVQTATGFNHAEMQAAGAAAPKALPMQILDYATGHLMAFATSAALVKQQQQGGSWHVRVSLAQTAQWLRNMGRVNQNAGSGFTVKTPDRKPYLQTWASGFGELTGFAHSARLARTPAMWTRPSMPPGSHLPEWPEASP
jgi:hypothetical protein